MKLSAALLTCVFLLGLSSPSGHGGAAADVSVLGGASHSAAAPARFRARASAGSDMTYHGGWVMRTNTTYAIYWVPSGFACGAADPACSSYEAGINRYFKDVAAASGSDTNVYSVDTQYYDTTGPIAYQSTFGGWVVDHGPFPPYNPGTSCIDGTDPVCLTDQQVRAEIQNVITVGGLAGRPVEPLLPHGSGLGR